MERDVRRGGSAPVLLATLLLAATASAATLTYDVSKGGAWTEASSWQEGAVPAAGDTLVIPGNARLTDADTAAATVAAQITVAANMTLTVDNAETLTMAGYIKGGGRLVKLGTGLLDFQRVPTSGELTAGRIETYMLSGGLVVSNGTVRFPSNGLAAGVEWVLGPTTVAAPGVLDVPANCNCVFRPLQGDGTILNSKNAMTQLRPEGTSVFDGYLCGGGIRVYTRGDLTFTCMTNSIAFDEFATWGGRISLPHFGNRGELSPAGPNSMIRARDYGGTIRYLGTGETTDRYFNFMYTGAGCSCGLDAGPHGGVTFSGGVINMDRGDLWTLFYLDGSNTAPMTISCPVKEISPTYFVKQGSGTWRFADMADNASYRLQKGIYEVNDGVLQFDSIGQIGAACALGPQTKLIPRTNPAADRSNTVDTAFLLGTVAGKTGTLQYTGTAEAKSDRLIGVVGRGRLENASGQALIWSGVRAAGSSSQAAELILAGDTAVTNTLTEVRDGTDGKPLSVTKEGYARWTLGRNTTFSGKLTVKSGTLAIAHPKKAFSWYKWTIRESETGYCSRTGTGPYTDTNVGARQLRFYDADGHDISTGRFTEDSGHVASALQPGYMTYDGDIIRTFYSGRNLDHLFDNSNTEWLVLPKGAPTRRDQPTSWFSVVFRFPENTPPAASYDFLAYGGNGRSILSWTMYGSSDGVTWYELDVQDKGTASNWMSDGTPFNSPSHGTGFALVDDDDPTTYGLPNVAGTEVAAGAALVCGRPELEMPLPSPLTVAPGGSYGRYAGFAVPTIGVVNVSVPITWFRLTVMETTDGKRVREGGATSDPNVQMEEFALYDAAGVRRNMGLRVDARCQPSLLEPGSVTYARSGYNYYGDRDADKLFDEQTSSGNGWCVSYGTSPRRDVASTWIQLTMRLADADPQIASYDWMSRGDATGPRIVSSWRLEGSADGVKWITLDEQIDRPDADRPLSRWWSDGSTLSAGARRTGMPISTAAMSQLVSLKDFTCAIDLSDCTGFRNLTKWKVTLNGVEVPRMKMIYQNGTLNTLGASLFLIIR